MTNDAASYHGYRFPPEIISHAIWLYHRFCLSFRDTEDLLAQRGITVSYEAIRLWCRRFGPEYARILRRRQGRLGDTWYLDELSCTARSSTRTTEQKCLISRLANASGRCGGSSPPLTRNDSCLCMDSFGISFAWGATSYGRHINGC
jgi:putative transposase